MIRSRTIGAGVMILAILIPAGMGFSLKFKELLFLSGDPDGAFAIMPVVSYLTTSVGFFFFFVYAALHGMFHNIEQPKRTFLDTERELDRDDDAAELSER
jgi:hypothetical protein